MKTVPAYLVACDCGGFIEGNGGVLPVFLKKEDADGFARMHIGEPLHAPKVHMISLLVPNEVSPK